MNCREMILKAAYRQISKKTIDKIRVSEILEEAKVSKQTFYRYYSDKYEMTNDLFQKLFLQNEYSSQWKSLYKKEYENFYQHKSLLKNVLESPEYRGCASYFKDVRFKYWTSILEEKRIPCSDELKCVLDGFFEVEIYFIKSFSRNEEDANSLLHKVEICMPFFLERQV